ncbi:MAG TPA: hypothetical protein VMP01_20540 [Pirellulaceae bacterium]|nr:hypothetical protein [Pirellulaceae bacterium]
MTFRWAFAIGLLLIPGGLVAWGADADLGLHLKTLQAVGPQGAGHREAAQAARAAAQAAPAQLPQILAAMDGANPIALNWLAGVAEAVAQRAPGPKAVPVQQLESFLADTKHSPRGRRLAYELIANVDQTAESRLIPKLLNDPSLELRRDAVALALANAAKAEAKEDQVVSYRAALRAARDQDQIKTASDAIKKLGGTVDLPLHYGFLQTWKIIGPFDNIDDKGWDVAYPPEETIDLKAKYAGQKGEVGWIETTTSDESGIVDLTKVLDKHKGAIAYAYAEFISDKDQEVEFRFATWNANKLWLNGELLTANHIYHANMPFDQYVGRGTLRKGKNSILLKIAQNEQTEMWAQTWSFHLRVCDAVGTAVLSQDRPSATSAAVPRTVR